MEPKHKRVKYACYTTNLSMSVVGTLSPILFVTFRTMYGISYTLLGLLVLLIFCTQLVIDLIFSFFSHKFNIPKCVKSMPILVTIGLLIYALWPYVFPNHVYTGLVISTLIFSAAAGFNEVLASPVIAALPSDDPDREMSKLHSIYAWGVMFMVIVSTVFLKLFGNTNWQWLALFYTLIPLSSIVLFSRAEIPPMETPEKVSGAVKMLKNKTLWLCFGAIFLAGATECTMNQWGSSYLEMALGIPKVWGDIFGVAMFGMMLGLGRTLYSKFGKNIGNILFLGAIGAMGCYLIAAVSSVPIIGLIACALTGFCASMLWPGSILVSSDRIPEGGVFVYAMMAAGGDLGASVGPQLVGLITDAAIASPKALDMAQRFALTPEQLGMKLGLLVGMVFPIVAIPLYLYIKKTARKA